MAITLGAASAALGQSAHSTQTAHPAVVRIMVPERGGSSYGSGALVAVNETHGLVLTNWHVVRDAAGPIQAAFPDGFRSGAAVLRVDRDWDLAALAVWRPSVQPIGLAAEAPRPGETLTIAGYGGEGWYRALSGTCTQYVSPGRNQPFEMVELAAPARNGDSGGPILNSRGELAGVLFGSAFGRTTGSYCGRVRWFLDSVAGDFQRLPSAPTLLAEQPRRDPAPVAAIGAGISAAAGKAPEPLRRPAAAEISQLPTVRPQLLPAEHAPSVLSEASGAGSSAGSLPPSMPSRLEQFKTILAGIGLLALLLHAMRLLGAAAG